MAFEVSGVFIFEVSQVLAKKACCILGVLEYFFLRLGRSVY